MVAENGRLAEDRIAERLKELRQSKISEVSGKPKVTQREVGKAIIGRDWRAYSNWEQDRAKPSPSHLIKLAKYFNTTVDYIVGFDSETIATPHLTWGLEKQPTNPAHRRAVTIWERLAEGKEVSEIMTNLEINEDEIRRSVQDVMFMGLIKIEKVELDEELAKKLKEKYNLLEARVLNFTPSRGLFRRELLGYVASRYLVTYINTHGPGLSLGIAGGYSAAGVCAHIQRGELRNIALYPLVVHPVTHQVDASANAIVGRLVYNHWDYEVEGHSLNASCFSKAERDQITRHILNKASAVDIILAGVGTLEFVKGGLMTHMLREEEIQNLRDNGAIGDFLFHIIDQNGKLIESDVNDRICSIDIGISDDLVNIRKPVIVIVASEDRAEAARGALRGQHANVIIADQATAIKLLGTH